MQAQFQKFLKQNCIYYPFNLKVFLYCCLLIIAFIITMFSFQGAVESLRDSMKHLTQGASVNPFKMWWRLAGSNRWPPACKAGALPAELNPQIFIFNWSGGPRTRFPAGKPRRLQQSTGLLPRAAFRVHFGFACLKNSIASVSTPISVFCRSGGPKWTRTIDLTIISRVL